jgi:hypothetical protein
MLPGDGFEQTDADDDRQSKGQHNCPGVSGKREAGARGGHGAVSLEKEVVHTNRRVGYKAEFLEEGCYEGRTSYNNNELA